MANTYISRTFGTPTNANIWTYSVWIKRSQLGADQCFLAAGTGATDRTEISFSGSDYIAVYRNIGGSTAGIETSELYRDTSGWYNLVFQNNSGTMTIYVNGETVTQNTSSLGTNKINQASVVHQIGEIVATGNPLNALMSHINFVDGTIYPPTAFGSTDSVTGEWKINTAPSVTYGNNGFFILKDGNSITDQSGKGNNWTLSSGTLTDTKDCPSNVFATWNFLDRYYTQAIFSNGNATVQTPNASETYCTSNLGMSSGKYYMEVEIYDGSNRDNIGIVDSVATANNGSNNLYQKPKGYSYRGVGGVWNNDSQLSGTFSAYGSANGHKVMIAVDLDNSKLYFGFNGTWQNSGDPTSGSTGTGAISITPTSDLSNGCYFFAVGDEVTSDDTTYRGNFGNGYFGTTAVSSAGTNASGNGIFEYNVPTGYTALSTKGLNL